MIHWIRHILAESDDGIGTIVILVIFGIISLIGSLSQALAKSRQKREQQKRGLQPGGAQPPPPASKPATVDEFLEQIKRMARGEGTAGTQGTGTPGIPPSAGAPQQQSHLQQSAPPPPPRPASVLQARPGAPPPPRRPTPQKVVQPKTVPVAPTPRSTGLQMPKTPPPPVRPARPTPVAPVAVPAYVDRPPAQHLPPSESASMRAPAPSGPPKPAALTQAPRTGPPKRRMTKRPPAVTAKPATVPEGKGKPIRPLVGGSPAQLRAALRARLAAGPGALREAVLLSEVLGQPISMRRGPFRRPGMPGRLF